MVYFKRRTLKIKQLMVAKQPKINTGSVIGPKLGVRKKPSTVEPNNIFDKSARYFERISI